MTGIKESKEKGINEVLKFRKSRCWLWVYVEKMQGIVKKMDFTLSRYKELCLALLDSGYTPLTVYSYLVLGGQKNNNNNKLVVLRHDIDRKPKNALRMAKLEHELGIQSTYYFRFPYTFKPDIIRKINDLGHEVGYHYEVLSKANSASL